MHTDHSNGFVAFVPVIAAIPVKAIMEMLAESIGEAVVVRIIAVCRLFGRD